MAMEAMAAKHIIGKIIAYGGFAWHDGLRLVAQNGLNMFVLTRLVDRSS